MLMGSNGLVRFLVAVTAVALTAAAAGGVVLTLQPSVAPSDRVEYAVGRVPGTVLLEPADDPGPGPFTNPVAVDLGLDPMLLPLAPLNAEAIDSAHHRNSAADLLAAGAFGQRLVRMDRAGTPLTTAAVGDAARETLDRSGVLDDLADTDGDGLDDDGRFTLAARDGSAVCVRLPVRRVLAEAQGLQLDGTIPVSGYWWSPYGPCGHREHLPTGSEVRVGTTAGVYGATLAGEVCDVGLLAAELADEETAREAWRTVLGTDGESLAESLSAFTAVVLLADTTVTDHFLDGGRIRSRFAILQRGTAVLVDATGLPRVRCISGSPLRAAAPIPAGVTVEGTPWDGFSLERVQMIPAAARTTSRFVLVDVHTGLALRRAPGVTGALTRLAGAVYPPATG